MSKSGWMDQDLFSTRFSTHFLQHAVLRWPIVLLLDCHTSHLHWNWWKKNAAEHVAWPEEFIQPFRCFCINHTMLWQHFRQCFTYTSHLPFHPHLEPSGIHVPSYTPRSSYSRTPPSTPTSVSSTHSSSGDCMPRVATSTSVSSTPSSSPSVLTEFWGKKVKKKCCQRCSCPNKCTISSSSGRERVPEKGRNWG